MQTQKCVEEMVGIKTLGGRKAGVRSKTGLGADREKGAKRGVVVVCEI